MSLTSGQSLTFYEILGPLGAGGMGEVYRARDTRLDREVAIKVLPEHFAEDVDRLRRFEREAKTLASLNHTNIAGIHGIDQVGDTCFLAMELVAGEDLAERLARGRIPVDEAIDLARQLAEGLEVAHEAGIIHRDLKPANIRITPDGVVKVLDFGLAKPTGPSNLREGSTSAKPDSVLVTEEGLILGTPTYMSPEQARAKPVDRRTDIWAFGCVFYECLTGKRAFEGDSFSDLMAVIIGSEPDWSTLPSETSLRVRELLARCLQKDPRARLRDIGEARVMLSDSAAFAVGEESQKSNASRRSPAFAIGMLALAGAIVFAATRMIPASIVEKRALRLSTALSANEALHNDHYPSVAISPDGARLAWVGGPHQRVMTRALDVYDVFDLEGTEDAECPSFSPDGEWVAYFSNNRIYKVRVTGGQPVLLVNEAEHSSLIPNYDAGSRGLTWGADGWLTFSPTPTDGLFRVRDSGGEVVRLTAIDVSANERTHRWPQAVDEARAILFTFDDQASSEHYDDATIEAIDLETGERHVVLKGASMARYAAGSLIFAREGQLFHQPLDLATWSLSGQPKAVIPSVVTDVSSGAVHFDLSLDGTLVYAPGDRYDQEVYFAWATLDGESEDLGIAHGSIFQPVLSPDERRLAYIQASTIGKDIWVYDIERGTSRRATDSLNATVAVWTPDGEHLVFTRETGLYKLRLGSTKEPELLFAYTMRVRPYSFVDDHTILMGMRREETGYDIVTFDTETGEVRDVLAGKYFEVWATRSPDGELLAYCSTASGELEVYLTRWDDPSVSWQVSDNRGVEPQWSPDGKTLFYLESQGKSLWSVEVSPGEIPRLSAPRLLVEDFFFELGRHPSFGITRDGRFVTVKSDQEDRSAPRELRVLPGWVAEQAAAIR